MTYEEKYNQALERAKTVIKDYESRDLKDLLFYAKSDLETIFPELKEDEDEKIRKELIAMVSVRANCWDKEKFVAWLEKQCEQKPIDESKSKFKVGDWIINNDKRIAIPTQILEIEKYGYITSMGYTSFDKVKTDYHLWTIQDAKDGDVLVTDSRRPFIFKGCLDEEFPNSPVAYCGIDTTDQFYNCNSNIWWLTNENVYPAIKEQRDLLFQKMKEAGYEWDIEKKELKKIERNPTWSEEDEKKIMWLVRLISTAGFRELDTDKMPCSRSELLNWLKSLKDR